MWMTIWNIYDDRTAATYRFCEDRDAWPFRPRLVPGEKLPYPTTPFHQELSSTVRGEISEDGQQTGNIYESEQIHKYLKKSWIKF